MTMTTNKPGNSWSALLLFLFCVFCFFLVGWKFYLIYGAIGTVALFTLDFRTMQLRILEIWLATHPTESKVKRWAYVASFLIQILTWPASFPSYLIWRRTVDEIEG